MRFGTGTVLLYSGGMDSYCAEKLYDYDVVLYIHTGSRYDEAQLNSIARHPPKNLVIDKRLSLAGAEVEDDPTATVPARNLYFITLASYYGTQIHLCSTKDSKHADKDAWFTEHTQDLLNHIYYPHDRTIEVVRPFGDMGKNDIIASYLFTVQGASLQKLEEETFSCYEPVGLARTTACGKCVACLKKREALDGYRRAHKQAVHRD